MILAVLKTPSAKERALSVSSGASSAIFAASTPATRLVRTPTSEASSRSSKYRRAARFQDWLETRSRLTPP